MQENNEQNQGITVQGYYQGLTKKEKSQMLLYICQKYGYMQNTIRAKLTGVNKMRDYERKDCEEAIRDEALWRK